MSNITILSKPACVQCDGTYRSLDRKQLTYEVLDMLEDERLLSFATRTLQAKQAPVVIFHEGTFEEVLRDPSLIKRHWTGHRPDSITAMATELHEVGA